MSQSVSNIQQGRESTSLAKSQGNPNGKSYKELSKRNMNIESSEPRFSNASENDVPNQQMSFLEELASREEEIRRMLYEQKPNKPKESGQDKVSKKNVYSDLVKQDSDDEECTFKPKINPKTNKLIKRSNTDQPINEVLYKSAFEKKLKDKETEAEVKQNLSKIANSNKISVNSMKIVFKRIETALRNLIQDIEEPDQRDTLSFEGLGILLQRLGVFQNLEFAQADDASHRSSLSLSQSRVKPQVLAREIAFHENLWRILVSASDNQNFISSEIIFRFLMVLLEDKTTVAESSSFLQEIMNIGLEDKGITKDNNESAFGKIKHKNQLWDMDKLVTEFRKLFNDKTKFMNIYSSVGILPSRSTIGDEHNSFRPQINAKSKDLDMKNTGNYKEKVRSSQSTKLQNRFDILFEYHKYIKEKKNEEMETKLEQELANCTFKPQITEYKKKDKDGNPSSMSTLTSQDVAKAKRHELLYGVAKVQKEKLSQKMHEAKKQEEDKELSQCTFQPKINTNSEEYSIREQSITAGPPPKGYRKAVERMKIAEKIREEKKAEKEYVPRGENYEKIKNSDFKPPSFLSRPKIKKDDPLVYVDVNIGPGKTGRIGIHRGDDAKTLAKNFARTYSLPPVMKESLEKLLQNYINSYFPENGENHEEEEEEEDDEEEHEEEPIEGQEAQNKRDRIKNYNEQEEEEDEEGDEDEEFGDEDDDGEQDDDDDDEELAIQNARKQNNKASAK